MNKRLGHKAPNNGLTRCLNYPRVLQELKIVFVLAISIFINIVILYRTAQLVSCIWGSFPLLQTIVHTVHYITHGKYKSNL